ncbi:YxeA family protein [Paenibacillus sp. 1001270B_150601_E10]|uniref:YxeA family protein n=1 Tax=Paenibacillus sp. 1001270B_150601_E10 TaxID=2787079 RepID=UPI00189F13DB|nr:YxeA family protein [Paenibacillus sp. 1001270B_150601_E10]
MKLMTWKSKQVWMIISIVAILMLAGCGGKEVLLEKDYYVQVAGSPEQTKNEQQYIYNITGFDKNGNEQVVYFYVEEPYKEGTLLRVPRSSEGYTGNPTVIEENDLPAKVKEIFKR